MLNGFSCKIIDIMGKIDFDLNERDWVESFDNIVKENNLNIPKYDKLDFLSETNYQLTNKEQVLIDIIKQNNIILYHGCKAFNVDDYYKNGIQIPSKEFYISLFNKYLNEIKIELSDVDKIKLEDAIENRKLENALFGLFLPQQFEKECSHYVLFGSEMVTYYFVRMFGEYAYEKLIRIGTPTIFKIKIPIDSLSEYNIRAVCAEIIKCYLDIKSGYTYENNLCPGIKINYSLPSYFIISHNNPKKCYSYHLQRQVKFEQTKI